MHRSISETATPRRGFVSQVVRVVLAVAFVLALVLDADSAMAAVPSGATCTILHDGDSGAPALPYGASGSAWLYLTCSGSSATYWRYTGSPLSGSYVTIGSAQWVSLPGAVSSGSTETAPVVLEFTDSVGAVLGSVTLATEADVPGYVAPSESPSPSPSVSDSPSPSDTPTPTVGGEVTIAPGQYAGLVAIPAVILCIGVAAFIVAFAGRLTNGS